ncbi:DUF4249 family protein [Flavobacterium sp.]|uniref:DUF4249 family protein n=1 Tax=Flavobacterium sp. TaxID=239 RepID=UPI001210ABD2|nr:DUF4249 family protein [Flavobacterium sp.]RZJ73460.1 MAG: DUF4249 domain-containing protein [Flavobacterium sp.]
MKIFLRLTAAFSLLCLFGCTDPYVLQTRNFESALIIEASITNELKQHAVKISRAYRLEESGPTFETGASVYVQDDLGNVIDFEQQDTMYVSENAFLPDAARTYSLHISTSDGNSYSSTAEKLTTVTPIGNLSREIVSMGGVNGVQIRANTFDPTGNSKYYRYEYEEAGRFATPNYFETEVVVGPDDSDEDNFEEILLQPRTEQAHVCYRQGKSKSVVLTTTTGLGEDRVVEFPVRTIADTSYIVNDRYSIKVRQYVQSLASYTFYKTLSELSSIGNILSQTQPGFFYGNVRNDDNSEEKVIGFFEVSSVSEAVMAFDYNEVFPNNLPIPWPYECSNRTLNPENWSYPRPLGDAHVIIDLTQAGTMDLSGFDANGWFIMTSDQCVDCRVTGSNVPPPYWQN